MKYCLCSQESKSPFSLFLFLEYMYLPYFKGSNLSSAWGTPGVNDICNFVETNKSCLDLKPTNTLRTSLDYDNTIQRHLTPRQRLGVLLLALDIPLPLSACGIIVIRNLQYYQILIWQSNSLNLPEWVCLDSRVTWSLHQISSQNDGLLRCF